MILKPTQEMIDIGNRWGLMMLDPIQSYHIANAMEDYKNQKLEEAKALLKHCQLRMEDSHPKYQSSIELIDKYLTR